MSFQNNAFRKGNAPRPDLSRAPQHVRDAIDVTIEHRPGEITGRAITSQYMANIPNARFLGQYVQDTTEKREFLLFQMLDYQGRVALAQFEAELSTLPALIKSLGDIYRRTGGDPKDLFTEETP